MNYPLFTPPEDLVAKDRTKWRKADAERYCDWLLDALPNRVSHVQRFLGVGPRLDPEDALLRAGRRMAGLLPQPEYSQAGRRERATLAGHQIESDTGPLLTVIGYAIAADLGLLMASQLLARFDLQWQIVDRPRSDVWYRLPVLVGFQHGTYMEPIHMSNVAALGLLHGNRGPSAWADVYRSWSARATPRKAAAGPPQSDAGGGKV